MKWTGLHGLLTVTHHLKEVGVFSTEIKGRDQMDTRIWMKESFWESTEEQNVKESLQENAEHSSKDQNENGENKLVDQKTSLWQQTYENILVGMESPSNRKVWRTFFAD